MKIIQALFIINSFFLLVACSSKPSDADLKPAVTNYVSEIFPNQKCFLLRNIKKTNGFERQDNTYQVTAEWEIVATKTFEIANYSSKCVEKPSFDSMKSPNDIMGLFGMLGQGSNDLNYADLTAKGYLKQIECEKLIKGESCSVIMEMIFRKTEKGWIFVD
jgi:hypothetical protein